MAKVSIIVPIYNVELYIAECIESIQNQTLSDIEIILIDDGSSDGSAEIVDFYASKDNRIIAIHKENSGVVNTRKIGLQIAQSPYVCFVDGDDYIHKRMCERLYNLAIDTNVEAVFNQSVFRVYDENCEILKGYLEDGIYREKEGKINYIKNNIWNFRKRSGVLPFLWCNMYRIEKAKEIFKYVPDDISFSEDATYIYMFLAMSKDICILNEPYYYYRMRSGSVVQTIDKTLLLNIAKRYLVTYDFFEKNNVDNMLYRQLKYNIFDEILIHFFKREGMSSFLFPYEKVKKGTKTVLYAAGNVGKSYYKQIEENNYCEIVLWVDTNYQEMDNKLVENPEKIRDIEFEAIVIAVLNESIAKGIQEKLIADYCIDSNKIVIHTPKSFFDLLD